VTAKNAHTLISFTEHCEMLTSVKLNTMKKANNPLNKNYNKKRKTVSEM